MESKREHLYSFDYLRMLACLCVVFMHTASGPLTRFGGTGWRILNTATSFSFCAVPLFFMMSGYLLLSSRKTSSVSVLFRQRLPRLVIPLVSWSVIAVLWLSFRDGFTFAGFAKRLVSGVGSPVMVHFWFMYTLIALYLISPFLYGAVHSLDRKGHVLLAVLCVAAVAVNAVLALVPYDKYICFIPGSVRQLLFFDGHIAAFILGYYLGSLKKKIPSALLAAAGLADLALITVMTDVVSAENGAYTQTWQMQNSFFEVFLAACVFLLFKQNLNRTGRFISRIATPVSTLAFPVYLMHNVLLSVLISYGVFTGGTINTFLFTLIIFALCIVFLKTVSSIPVVSYLLCGVPFRQACESCNWLFTFRRKK